MAAFSISVALLLQAASSETHILRFPDDIIPTSGNQIGTIDLEANMYISFDLTFTAATYTRSNYPAMLQIGPDGATRFPGLVSYYTSLFNTT